MSLQTLASSSPVDDLDTSVAFSSRQTIHSSPSIKDEPMSDVSEEDVKEEDSTYEGSNVSAIYNPLTSNPFTIHLCYFEKQGVIRSILETANPHSLECDLSAEPGSFFRMSRYCDMNVKMQNKLGDLLPVITKIEQKIASTWWIFIPNAWDVAGEHGQVNAPFLFSLCMLPEETFAWLRDEIDSGRYTNQPIFLVGQRYEDGVDVDLHDQDAAVCSETLSEAAEREELERQELSDEECEQYYYGHT